MAPVAGSFRRLAAASYDGLLLLAALMLVTALLQVFTHGQAIIRQRVGAFEYAYRGALALCVLGYFGSAWTRRGQTLGMKAWAIRVETESGTLPKLADVARRLACAAPLYLLFVTGLMLLIARRGGWWVLLGCVAPLAASYAWLLVTRRGTLHDRWSRTRVVRVGAGS